ncbi:MAG: radical SAM family heme chaperone HemW [Bacteroidota bacterium]
MGGIYVHIPFCRQACTYCDFHFSTNHTRLEDIVAAICAEAQLRSDFFPRGEAIETLYLGGGTPSLLGAAALAALIEHLRQTFPFAPDAEITLEANPDDLSPVQLEALAQTEINRLSIGIQSFHDADLRLMRRSHDAAQAHACLKDTWKMGFHNLSLDLIYGIPGASMARWRDNVQRVLEYRPAHLSAYALTVEPRTQLQHQVIRNQVVLPPDQSYQEQFFFLIDALEAAGYEHYELSNFARPGHRSCHNSNYWLGVPYLGLGPSAHSYRNHSRSWNVRNNARYLKAIAAGGTGLQETEQLSALDQLNEYLMTHLRKAEGVDLRRLKREWGFDLLHAEAAAVDQFAQNGWLAIEGEQLRLHRTGKMMSDAIIREFFQVE